MFACRSTVLGIAALVSLASDGRTPPAPGAQQERLVRQLEQLVERTVAEQGLPGLSVVVDLGGEPLLARGWGMAAPARLIAASDGSPYRAGSLTTQFVAVAVLQLADEERIGLDERVATYLPELAGAEGAPTVAQLLANGSGFPPLSDFVAARRGSDELFGPESVLAWLAGTPPLATPGECCVHSDSNTYVLGLLLERVSRHTVQEYLEGHIFGVLGMEDTQYVAEQADLHASAAAGQEIAGTFVGNGGAPPFFGAEMLCTSARDLVRFQRGLLDLELISEASFARMTRANRLPDGSSTHFGLGVNLTQLDGRESLTYGGGMSGSRVHLAWYPAFDLTVAVLADGDDVDVARLERRLARRVFELPEPGIQDLPLSPEERAVYLGDYYIACDRVSVLDGADGHLVVQAPAQEPQVLLSQGYHLFVTRRDPEVRYRFAVEGDVATGFVLEEHGTQTNAVRLR